MDNKYLLGALVVLVLGGFVWYISHSSAPASPAGENQSTTTPSVSTSTQSASSTQTSGGAGKPGPFAFSLIKGDTVASWNFQGAYSGNAELEQKAQTEIARLTALLGSGQYTDYQLYVSIANQYDLLGNGAQEFAYLKKALGIDSTLTGLAWGNMGQLLSRLGAYRTARVAFEKAVAAQPTPQYKQALSDFLKEHPK